MTHIAKKQAALITILLIAGLLYFFAIQLVLLRFNSREAWYVVLGIGLVYGAWLSYSFGLIETKLTAAYLYLGLPLTVAVLGFGRPSVIGAAIIFAVVLWAAYDSIRGELLSRLEYSTWRAFGNGTKWVLTGLIVAVLGLSLPHLTSSTVVDQFKLSPDNAAVIMRPFNGLIMSMLPGYTPSATVDDLIKRQTPAAPDVSVSSDQVSAVRQELSQRFGQPLSGTETLPELTSQTFNAKIDLIRNRNPILGVVLFLLSALLLFRLLIPVLSLIVRLLIFIIHALAVRIGLSSVTTQQAMIDRLSL